jgi:hypothetical protein
MEEIIPENSFKLGLSNIAAKARATFTMTNMRKLTPKLRIFGNRLDFLMASFCVGVHRCHCVLHYTKPYKYIIIKQHFDVCVKIVKIVKKINSNSKYKLQK